EGVGELAQHHCGEGGARPHEERGAGGKGSPGRQPTATREATKAAISTTASVGPSTPKTRRTTARSRRWPRTGARSRIPPRGASGPRARAGRRSLPMARAGSAAHRGRAVGGTFGPVLLSEGEDAVDDHDHEDGDAELRHAGDEGQASRNPQHEGE